MPTRARDGGQRGWGLSFTMPVGMNQCRQTLREYISGTPRGLVAPEAESALLTLPLPRASRKKWHYRWSARVGWTRSAPVRSQNRKTAEMGQLKFITKYRFYLQLCSRGGRI